nr:MAG TPA: hypothetical protein [Caudoviricetes sp.]
MSKEIVVHKTAAACCFVHHLFLFLRRIKANL